jgi:hypothetical protein
VIPSHKYHAAIRPNGLRAIAEGLPKCTTSDRIRIAVDSLRVAADRMEELERENAMLRESPNVFIMAIVEGVERENAMLKDELDRLVEIETAARQWWQAECRHSLIAACKLGEALGYQVIWPEGHISSNDLAHGTAGGGQQPKTH